MSWFAQHYVLNKCSHPLVKGNAKFLLLVIAYYVRKDHITTPLLTLDVLSAKCGLDKRTVYELLKLLRSIGELQRHVRGKRAVYEMPPLKGPLFVDASLDYERHSTAKMRINDPHAATRMRKNDPDLSAQKRIDDLHAATRMRKNDPDLAKIRINDPHSAAVQVLVVEDQTTTTSAAAAPNEFIQRLEQAHAFLDWWSTAFPDYHEGAKNNPRERHGDKVKDLLEKGHTTERLKAMALRMWTLTTDGVRNSNRWFIATSDHSIDVLWQKVDFLDLEVARLGSAAAAGDVWSAVLRRVESKIGRSKAVTFFRDTHLVADRGDMLVVSAPSANAAWITKHLLGELEEAMREERPGVQIEFVDEVDVQRMAAG